MQQGDAHVVDTLEGIACSGSQRMDTLVRAGEGKKQLKRWTLEFGTKYDGWQKPPETNDPYESQFEILRHVHV